MAARREWAFWGLALLCPAALLWLFSRSITVDWLVPVAEPRPAYMPAIMTRAETAARFVELLAAGDWQGAEALAGPLETGLLRRRVTSFAPAVTSSAILPDGDALVWVTYRMDGQFRRGYYLVEVEQGRVEGPFAPDGGYRPFALSALDGATGRPVSLPDYHGRGLILVTPRRPDPQLPTWLEAVRKEALAWGVHVVLAVDTAAPDYQAYARKMGYEGPVWRVKGNLENVRTVSSFSLLGATGLLVDRTGTVVAPLSALDPARYGQEDLLPVLPQLLKAFGLTG